MELLLDIFVRGTIVVVCVIVLTRLNGLRSFSKMSSFDFSLTVAFGSIIGGTLLSPDSPYLLGGLAVAMVFLVQAATALARRKSETISDLLDNAPILLMDGETLLPKGMAAARVTEADIRAKLREANVLSPSQIHAVVMESTGDVSVLHGSNADQSVDLDTLLQGVKRLD